MSNRNWSLTILLILTTVGASAAGPEPQYKAPRTEHGTPIFGRVELQFGRPARTTVGLCRQESVDARELEAQKAARAKAFDMISRRFPSKPSV